MKQLTLEQWAPNVLKDHSLLKRCGTRPPINICDGNSDSASEKALKIFRGRPAGWHQGEKTLN